MQQLELPLDQSDQPIQSTLDNRGTRYGDFRTQAALSQALSTFWKQHYYQLHPNTQLPPFILESIEMIFHKLARLANGDPLFIDSYRDLVGYSQLVVDALQTYPGASDVSVTYTTVPEPTKPDYSHNDEWGH